MAESQATQFNILETIVRLRRDNDYNYEKIKSNFYPMKGEICLVDTASDGLRAICGDGVSPFQNLEYLDIIVWGYYNEEDKNFYKDVLHSEVLSVNSKFKIYIDILTNKLYIYNGNNFLSVNDNIVNANASTPGIVKLYDELGENVDGTMTQKSITDALKNKVGAEVDDEQELLIFKTN